MRRKQSSFASAFHPRLNSEAVRSSVWAFGGFGAGQGLRLAGNLILARLLSPEAFGLMALVNGTLIGLNLLSDTGIRNAVIHHERGEEKVFLDTAWTLQVLRGFALFGLSVIVAWPISLAFGEPLLLPLLAVVGLTAVFNGLRSVMLFVHNRRLEMKPLVRIELLAQSAGLVAMILWAIIHPSVWSLAVGAVIGAVVATCLSHLTTIPHQHRLVYDKTAGRELIRFGKWILVSSSVTFFIGQADRFIVGGISDMTTLGLFSIAITLAMIAQESTSVIVERVLFPIYARVYRNDGTLLLRKQMRKSSCALYGLFLPILLILVVGGDVIVRFLYDPRYESAGPMLQIIASGVIGILVTNVAAAGLLATGNSKAQAIMQAVRLATFGIATVIGISSGDLRTFLLAQACARWTDYIPAAILLRRARLWNPLPDLVALMLAACGIILVVVL